MKPSRLPLLVLPVLLWFASAATGRAQTPALEIASPTRVTVYAKSELKQHSLYWSRNRKELSVSLHYSDDLYNDTTDSAANHDESFEFPIPGVSFDPATRLFTVDDGGGNPLPVAKLRTVAFVAGIEPTPNASFHIRHGDDGKIGVVLTVYRPEVAAALQAMPQSPGDERTVPMQSLLQK